MRKKRKRLFPAKKSNNLVKGARELMNMEYGGIDFQNEAEKIRTLSGSSYVLIITYEKDDTEAVIRGTAGDPSGLKRAGDSLGYSLRRKVFRGPGKKKRRFKSGVLVRVKTFYECLGRKISRKESSVIHKVLDIESLYLIELSCEDRHPIGCIVFVSSVRDKLKNREALQQHAVHLSNILMRQRAEKKAALSEARLAGILENINDVIWSAAWPDYGILFLSPSAERVFGRPLEELKKSRMMWADYIHPEDRYVLVSSAEQLLSGGSSSNEYRVIKPEGGYLWVWDSCRLIRDEGGKPVRVDGNIKDITTRKKAEIALRESERYNRTIVEIIPDMIIRTDRSGRYLDVIVSNDYKLARPREELIGKRVDEVFPPEDAARILQSINESIDTGSLQEVEYRLQVPAGNLWFEARIMSSGDDEAFALVRDITEEKVSESRLRKNLRYSNMLAGLSSAAVSATELDSFIEESLEKIGVTAGVSRSYFFRYDEERDIIDNTSEWCAEGIEPQKDNLQGLDAGRFAWLINTLKDGTEVCFSDIGEIPSLELREELRSEGILSVMIVPVFINGIYYGFIGFDDCAGGRVWEEEHRDIIRAAARIISGVIERVEANRQIRESEDFLKSIIDNMFDMISLTDIDGNFEFISPSHRVLGYEPRNLAGRNVMEFIHKENIPEVSSKLKEALSEPYNDRFEKVRIRFRRADGSYARLETAGKVLFDQEGKPKKLLFNSREIINSE